MSGVDWKTCARLLRLFAAGEFGATPPTSAQVDAVKQQMHARFPLANCFAPMVPAAVAVESNGDHTTAVNGDIECAMAGVSDAALYDDAILQMNIDDSPVQPPPTTIDGNKKTSPKKK